MAITTKAISVKLDLHTLDELEKEAYATGEKKNRIINRAIDFYINHLDSTRRKSAGMEE